MMYKQISLFDGFDATEKIAYDQLKLRSEREVLLFLKQFITLEEDELTPYRHKNGYYQKKAHYINGKKVNRQVYAAVKK